MASLWFHGTLFMAARQGCQIYIDTVYQNWGKRYQITNKSPNGHEIYQMALVLSK
jgi:hypothetical protein